MKKTAILMVCVIMLSLTGCNKASDLIDTAPTQAPVETKEPVADTQVDKKNTIPLSNNMNILSDWTIVGDYEADVTKDKNKDRIILATSAKTVKGEIQWDDAQYWGLAVATNDGAYNLFTRRMQGQVYAELNEAFISGQSTMVITAYVFSGTDREIYNYIFDGEEFVEEKLFSTKQFSTAGVNTKYSSFPEYQAKK